MSDDERMGGGDYDAGGYDFDAEDPDHIEYVTLPQDLMEGTMPSSSRGMRKMVMRRISSWCVVEQD